MRIATTTVHLLSDSLRPDRAAQWLTGERFAEYALTYRGPLGWSGNGLLTPFYDGEGF